MEALSILYNRNDSVSTSTTLEKAINLCLIGEMWPSLCAFEGDVYISKNDLGELWDRCESILAGLQSLELSAIDKEIVVILVNTSSYVALAYDMT